jgi:hypothetical protein
VFAVLAFALGEGIVSLLGYPVGGSNPLWVSLNSDLVVCTLLLIPCVSGVVFGRKAKGTAATNAWLPTVIGALVGSAILMLTLVTEIDNYA